MFMSIMNFQRVVMFVFNIISTNNREPYKSNTHNRKKRNKMLNFLSIGGFEAKNIRFLRFKDAFDRVKMIRIITNSTRRIVISMNIPNIIRIRRIRNDNISGKTSRSKENFRKNFRSLISLR